MRANEFLNEGRNHPVIVVDVQPDYCHVFGSKCDDIINFVSKQTGPVLMFVNADETGMSDDNVEYDIMPYWDSIAPDMDWSRVEIVDKGYGYLRSWMDRGEKPAAIIKVIREMYRQKVSDSRDLYGGENSPEYATKMRELVGRSFREYDLDDSLIVNWTSVAQLKQYNGAYIVGGARNECLREVELLMNAFNIKYKRIDSLVYG